MTKVSSLTSIRSRNGSISHLGTTHRQLNTNIARNGKKPPESPVSHDHYTHRESKKANKTKKRTAPFKTSCPRKSIPDYLETQFSNNCNLPMLWPCTLCTCTYVCTINRKSQRSQPFYFFLRTATCVSCRLTCTARVFAS